ncbi:MAG: flagellar type III secretion system pore protein FliP [Phycisphaerales bacterium]|nr:flagellar type III secretion system pore protein FliP [Phycisphaerales bacterium]
MPILLFAAPARAQDAYGPPASPTAPSPLAGFTGTALVEGFGPTAAEPLSINPISLLAGASQAFPGSQPGPADPSDARGISPAISVVLLLTVISLVPSIMLMCTCFVRMIVVLGLLKQALGTQSLPPPQVIVGLAMFMTILVMSPTIKRIDAEALTPYRAGQLAGPDELWDRAKQPLRDFMFDQIEATGNWSSLYMILNYRGVDTSKPEELRRADVDMVSLIPAYMLSELKTAFLMGFRVYLPFLVIDMVIASLLISMSMMMLPPVLISLPFKLLLFVLVDGWQLVVGSLMNSFVVSAPAAAESAAPAVGLLPALPAIPALHAPMHGALSILGLA